MALSLSICLFLMKSDEIKLLSLCADPSLVSDVHVAISEVSKFILHTIISILLT